MRFAIVMKSLFSHRLPADKAHAVISIQQQDFDVAEEYQALLRPSVTGAVVTFVGCVRDFADSEKTLFLQHYPGMTENVLVQINNEAHQRWPLIASKIIHRVGALHIDEQIVFVGVSSAHRQAAFDACKFIIDTLKTQAPFWKKEGRQWVEAKSSDQDAADAWLKN